MACCSVRFVVALLEDGWPPPRRLGVDETSFQKRHEYVTLVGDLDTGVVHHVADGRGKDALEADYEGLSEQELTRAPGQLNI